MSINVKNYKKNLYPNIDIIQKYCNLNFLCKNIVHKKEQMAK